MCFYFMTIHVRIIYRFQINELQWLPQNTKQNITLTTLDSFQTNSRNMSVSVRL